MDNQKQPDLEIVRKFFSERDRLARRLDIKLLKVAPGEAVARMDVREHHLNAADIVHGGAVFSLADFAFAVASNSHGNTALAVNVSITFMNAARADGSLTAHAREISRSSRLGHYEVLINDDRQVPIARFNGTVWFKSQPLPLPQQPPP